MRPEILSLLARLEALSPREKGLALLVVPVVLLLTAEFLVYSPARAAAATALKQAEQQQAEIKSLRDVLASRPAPAPLPGAEQLRSQRDALQAQIDAARILVEAAGRTVPWGTVVRATVAGTPGLSLTQLKIVPPELVYSPNTTKPTSEHAAIARTSQLPQPAKAASTAALAGIAEPLYRHRAELTVSGDFAALLGYVDTLQHVPGDLHWDRLALKVATFPRATLQLGLYTLSSRAETPFN